MTQSPRAKTREVRVSELIADFPTFMAAYEQAPPFSKSGQLERHRETIQQLRDHGSVRAALADDEFLVSLQATLRAWGIGVRASRIAEPDRFVLELRRWTDELEVLEQATIQSAGEQERDLVWTLVNQIDIVDNEARLVAMTKTLHHLLPDLVAPIDRAYTGAFLGWHIPEFQNRQREIFDSAWLAMQRIAASIPLDQYVGQAPWNTSITKAIDNALIGYCLEKSLVASSQPGSGASERDRGTRPVPQTSGPRREQWSISDLEYDLKEFAGVLRAAGLKDASIDTYVGRSETFIRWLAGKYRPRGPNS